MIPYPTRYDFLVLYSLILHLICFKDIVFNQMNRIGEELRVTFLVGKYMVLLLQMHLNWVLMLDILMSPCI